MSVEKWTVTTATDGQRTKTWVEVRTIWVEFKDARGAEFMTAHQLNNKISHVLSIHWYEGLTASGYRFNYRVPGRADRILNIEAVTNPREADDEMLVACIEAV